MCLYIGFGEYSSNHRNYNNEKNTLRSFVETLGKDWKSQEEPIKTVYEKEKSEKSTSQNSPS
jgi:hypothetical protein